MRNKIREKIVASVMLSAFAVTNSMTATFAMSDYYGYVDSVKPAIRTSAGLASVNLRSNITIPNSDSVVNLSLRDADVKQVLRMFADKAAMNIVFHESVKGKVTLDLVDMPINEAFNLVLQVPVCLRILLLLHLIKNLNLHLFRHHFVILQGVKLYFRMILSDSYLRILGLRWIG